MSTHFPWRSSKVSPYWHFEGGPSKSGRGYALLLIMSASQKSTPAKIKRAAFNILLNIVFSFIYRKKDPNLKMQSEKFSKIENRFENLKTNFKKSQYRIRAWARNSIRNHVRIKYGSTLEFFELSMINIKDQKISHLLVKIKWWPKYLPGLFSWRVHFSLFGTPTRWRVHTFLPIFAKYFDQNEFIEIFATMLITLKGED